MARPRGPRAAAQRAAAGRTAAALLLALAAGLHSTPFLRPGAGPAVRPGGLAVGRGPAEVAGRPAIVAANFWSEPPPPPPKKKDPIEDNPLFQFLDEIGNYSKRGSKNKFPYVTVIFFVVNISVVILFIKEGDWSWLNGGD